MKAVFPVALVLGIVTSACAGDWPQILGPNRNGVAVDETIRSSWPDDGPATVWKRQVGSGFSGVAVAQNTAVLFHRIDDEDVVEAMNAETGQSCWKKAASTRYQPGFTSDNGPRCVPVIHDGRVYAFGSNGLLRCLRLDDGRVVWERETHSEFGAPEGYFGAGSTPIVDGDKLIVNVGSRDGAAIVAFDRVTGKTIWKAVDDTASYSSPVAATIDGVRHVIVVTRFNAVSVNPENGSVRFKFPFGKRGPTVNGASPVVVGEHLFLTSSYGIGSILRRIHAKGADEVWADQDLMASQYATCVEHKGLLIGFDGRQDNGPASAALKCFNPNTREVLWSEDGFDYGTLIRAGDKLIALTAGGELILISASATSYQELARANVLNPTPRAHRLPALANGRLYVRDDDTLKCLAVK